MSSKLVKKLLQQTSATLTASEHDAVSNPMQSRKRKLPPVPQLIVTKEDVIQEHINSIIRLDNIIQKGSTKTTQKSYARQSTKLKQQQKQVQQAKSNAARVSNSRSSGSLFTQKPHEATYDKEKDKKRKEESYYEDLAKALKKAKKKKGSKK